MGPGKSGSQLAVTVGTAVGRGVGRGVGDAVVGGIERGPVSVVGNRVEDVGPKVGPRVGNPVGRGVGFKVGNTVGVVVGPLVGPDVGRSVGLLVGPNVGGSVGAVGNCVNPKIVGMLVVGKEVEGVTVGPLVTGDADGSFISQFLHEVRQMSATSGRSSQIISMNTCSRSRNHVQLTVFEAIWKDTSSLSGGQSKGVVTGMPVAIVGACVGLGVKMSCRLMPVPLLEPSAPSSPPPVATAAITTAKATTTKSELIIMIRDTLIPQILDCSTSWAPGEATTAATPSSSSSLSSLPMAMVSCVTFLGSSASRGDFFSAGDVSGDDESVGIVWICRPNF